MNKTPQQMGGAATAKKLRAEALKKYYESPNQCQHCGKVIRVREHCKVPATRLKRFCNRSCAATFNNKVAPKKPRAPEKGPCKRCGKEISYRTRGGNLYRKKYCGKCLGLSYKADCRVGDKRRKDVRRQDIQNDARRVYALSGKPYKCLECGYSRHVNVSHIKPVASFSWNTLVRIINAEENLVALCPTHHWEFDHGYLKKIIAG